MFVVLWVHRMVVYNMFLFCLPFIFRCPTVVQDRPFQCEQCPAAFARKPYLDIHMRTHTGERPFECDVCLKRFTQKSSLNIHKTVHTGKNLVALCGFWSTLYSV